MRLDGLGLDARDFDEAARILKGPGYHPLGRPSHFARAFAVATHPRLAVRLSDCCDGFAAYAAATMGPLAAWAGIHAPVVMDMRIMADETTLALVRRLEPVDPEDPHAEVADIAASLMGGRAIGEDEEEELDRRQPTFRRFLKDLRGATGRRAFDARPDNLMTLDGRLIVNDPIGVCVLGADVPALRRRLAEAMA